MIKISLTYWRLKDFLKIRFLCYWMEKNLFLFLLFLAQLNSLYITQISCVIPQNNIPIIMPSISLSNFHTEKAKYCTQFYQPHSIQSIFTLFFLLHFPFSFPFFDDIFHLEVIKSRIITSFFRIKFLSHSLSFVILEETF